MGFFKYNVWVEFFMKVWFWFVLEAFGDILDMNLNNMVYLLKEFYVLQDDEFIFAFFDGFWLNYY